MEIRLSVIKAVLLCAGISTSEKGLFTKIKFLKGLSNNYLNKMQLAFLHNRLFGRCIPKCTSTKEVTKEPVQVTRPEQFQALMAAQMLPGQPLPRHIAQINGKPKIAHMTRTSSGRKQVISWMDAPDDVYFRATETSK
ncbi:hypothetical protein NQ317_008108 [Molorchus minor]|uniref:Uncharacterized protein n=1 Tax=Molorchus minor TaxID=1323400 RepID=A0ABQ9JC33_9CUCU|nr:hypothetical protein NQ317_008108 [Molorchus minor]